MKRINWFLNQWLNKVVIGIMFGVLMLSFIIVRHDVGDRIVKQNRYKFLIPLRLKDATGIVELEGSLIKEEWILTAAHGLTSVFSPQSMDIRGTKYTIEQIVVHPEFNGFEHDIALIRLDKRLKGFKPVRMNKKKNELNQKILIIGRGMSGTGLAGPIANDGKLRWGTNKIDSVSSHWIMFRFDAPNEVNVTKFEGISGPGDSGGPALLKKGLKTFILGVSSNQINNKLGLKEGRYGVVEYYTRVSSYVDWIEKVTSGSSIEQKPIPPNLQKNKWGFPNSEIGIQAELLMDALDQNRITSQFMETVFYKEFRESFDLQSFVQAMAEALTEPRITSIVKAKNNVLIFEVQTVDGSKYYLQLEADKRDNYQIGGLIFKKLSK